MELRDIISCYTDRWVILSPQEYDERGVVFLWEVLDEALNLDEAKALRSNYESWEYSDVVIYDTCEPDCESVSSIVAQFYRVMYGAL